MERLSRDGGFVPQSHHGGGGDNNNDAIDASIRNQTDLSKSLATYSKDNYALSKPALTQAMGLYGQLAGGNRAQLGAAVAPQVNQISENYRGAQKTTGKTVGMCPFLGREPTATSVLQTY